MKKNQPNRKKMSASYIPRNTQLLTNNAQDIQIASKIIRYMQEEERF